MSNETVLSVMWDAEAFTAELEPRHFEKMKAVSTQVRLQDLSRLAIRERHILAAGGPKSDAGRKVTQELDRGLTQTEVIFGYHLPKGYIARAPKLKWVQWCGAGVDKLLADGSLKSPVIFTDAAGVMNVGIAEFIMGQMVALTKDMPEVWRLVRERRWTRPKARTTDIRGKTVGIIGYGNIGREVARLSKAFGARVLALDAVVIDLYSPMPDVDELLTADKLPYLLQQSDYVVLTLPYPPATDKLIGEAHLKLMKPTAYIINTSRGRIIDQKALVKALKQGWIAGAALDVVEEEPLPPDSELWSIPNLILTPHCAGHSSRVVDNEVNFFCENLRRYLAGGLLLNLVDKKEGF